MERRHRVWSLLAAGSAMLAFAACGDPRSPGMEADSPLSTVSVEDVFPAGPGQGLVLDNCSTCHSLVPIVVLQMDKDAWLQNSLDHRPRVPGVNDEDYRTMYEYLSLNFNPSRAVPTLPTQLLESREAH